MTEALHKILDIDKKVTKSFIKQTESGGRYIDVMSLVMNIDEEKARKIDLITGKIEARDALNYSFTVTTAIMKTYFEIKQ